MPLQFLVSECGEQATLRLSTAYEAVILRLSAGDCDRMPGRATRSFIVQAMLEEGRANGFDTDGLMNAGLLAVRLLDTPPAPATQSRPAAVTASQVRGLTQHHGQRSVRQGDNTAVADERDSGQTT